MTSILNNPLVLNINQQSKFDYKVSQILNSFDGKNMKLVEQEHWKTILRGKYFSTGNLIKLELVKCYIRNSDIKILIQTDLASLERLLLGQSYFNHVGLEQLMSVNKWQNLKEINLDNVELGNKGMQYLVKCNTNCLEELSIKETNISFEGYRNLSKLRSQKITKFVADTKNLFHYETISMIANEGQWMLKYYKNEPKNSNKIYGCQLMIFASYLRLDQYSPHLESEFNRTSNIGIKINNILENRNKKNQPIPNLNQFGNQRTGATLFGNPTTFNNPRSGMFG